jgi:IMP dehydrogenase
MSILNKTPALTFDDVLLVPQYSEIASRQDVDISTDLMGLYLEAPILSANMDTVTELQMAQSMHEAGALGILHRFAPVSSVVDWIRKLPVGRAIPSVGISEEDLDHALIYWNEGVRHICVDIAHGDSKACCVQIRTLKAMGFKVMAGNVATDVGAARLIQAGADAIKVGVGPGSMCTTRLVTGHGFPQLSAIMEVAKMIEREGSGAQLIADGGIRYSGDIVKALAAGANAVMLGNLLANTKEAPGDRIERDGKWYKQYRGMASRDAQVGWLGRVKNNAPEGEAGWREEKGSVAQIVDELTGGIRSGLSYSGCRNLAELREYAMFQVVTANCVKENGPHGK